jgi:shikimate dehydrogenase
MTGSNEARELTGKTRSAGDRFILAGIMGDPVAHSRSPLIYNHWMDIHGLKGRYVPLHVKIERLEAALRGLPALGFAGCNLTIPHKVKALGIVDSVTPEARALGAVNCIVVGDDGSLHGLNTDGYGYVANLKEQAPGWRPAAAPAVVLGAGGAARAVVAALLAEGVPEIRLLNRTRDAAEALGAPNSPRVIVLDWRERSDALAGAGLLVNTTSLGMEKKPPLDISLDALPASATVSDIVYAPLDTRLLAAARARGLAASDGLGMLLHQAVPSFAAWAGVTPAVTPTLRALAVSSLGA